MTEDTAGQDLVTDAAKDGVLESAWNGITDGAEAVGGWALDEVTAVSETAIHAGSGVVNNGRGKLGRRREGHDKRCRPPR